MKIGMLILGLIGSIIGIGGSIFTVIGGLAGTAAGVVTSNDSSAMTGAMVFWAGVYTSILCGITLIASVIGGVAKTKVTIKSFSISIIIIGLLNLFLFNYISGVLILISGILGIIGSKEGEEQDVKLFKSFIFYFNFLILLLCILFAVAIRNGNSSNKSSSDNVSKEIKPLAPVEPITKSDTNATIEIQPSPLPVPTQNETESK